MKKFLSLSMAALLAGTIVVLSFSDADARHRRWHGGGVAAGVAAGIIGGAIIGGAIANSNRRYDRRYDRRYRPRPVYRGDAHEEWCFRRYRSYRAYDNTFQPYRGGRRYCRSPYG